MDKKTSTVREYLVRNIKSAEKIPTRDGYGKGLIVLGKNNARVVVLSGDLTESTRANWFKEKFPKRFVEVGVAEQNMMGIAAGLALEGKIPFVSSYAVFSPGRNWDQMRVSVCYNNVSVKIAGAHAGISVGPDGATHQALEDIAITRVLPNMTVIVPCDAVEAEKATIASAKIDGPVYLRLGRAKTPVVTTAHTPFTIGKAEVFREGKDCVIIACGIMVAEALVAAEKLAEDGIEAMVVNNHTIKPLDQQTIITAAKKTGAVVTVEEHQIQGGLGSAVVELLTQVVPVPVRILGVRDRFGESGEPEELLKTFGLTAQEIVSAVKSIVHKKESCSELHEEELSMAFDRKKLIHDVQPEFFFRLKDGGVLRNIPQLKRALAKMSDDTFYHHVNEHKNDFSAWVKDIHGDLGLANALKQHKDKELIELEVEKALRHAFLQNKNVKVGKK